MSIRRLRHDKVVAGGVDPEVLFKQCPPQLVHTTPVDLPRLAKLLSATATERGSRGRQAAAASANQWLSCLWVQTA